ncbi:MAG: hypothetical protein PWQ57_3401 [Desulfovibrionales bacterium]|nr:hypothetical protein [Desulfovibrionales bacterium]
MSEAQGEVVDIPFEEFIGKAAPQQNHGGEVLDVPFEEFTGQASTPASSAGPDSLREQVETSLRNAPEPSFWDRVREVFNPVNDEDRTRAFLAVVNAEETNNALRKAGSSRRVSPSDFDRPMLADFETGFQGSVTGLMSRQELPDGPPPEVENYLPSGNRIARQAGAMLGDFPYMVMGMVLGGGPASPAGWGGSFALPAGLRKVYMDKIEKGEVTGWKDFSQRLGATVWEVLKSEATGAATHGAGTAAGPLLRVPAEIAAMTTVSAGLEGRVPEPQEFMDAAVLLGGAHLAGKVSGKLRTIYSRTGKRPVEVAEDAQTDPTIKEDILSSRVTPRAYSVYDKDGLTVTFDRELTPVEMEAVLGDRMKLREYLNGMDGQEVRALKGKSPEEYYAVLEKMVQELFPDGADLKFRTENGVLDYDHFLKDRRREEYIQTLPETLKRWNIKLEFIRDDAPKAYLIKKYFDPDIQADIWDMVIQHNNEVVTKFPRRGAKGRGYVESQIERAGNEASRSATPEGTMEDASTPTGNTKDNIATPEQEGKTAAPNETLSREGAEYERHLPRESEAPTRLAETGEIQAGAVVKKSDIIRELQKKLTAPIRAGKLGPRSKSVLGIYKVKPEVIRTRFANDISTSAHELGHHIHNMLWGFDKKALRPFEKELSAIATLGNPLEEGLAEFTSMYVANPAKAKQLAPTFYEFWERSLEKSAPDILETLREAQAAVDAWVKQPAEQKVLSSISVNEKTRNRVTFDEIHSYLWDDLRALDMAVRRITGKKWWYFGPFGRGEKLPASRDPYKLARALRGTPGRAQQWLYHSPYRFADYANVGKSLAGILKPVRGEIDAFRAYIVSKRALELYEREMASGVDLAAARATVRQWEGKFQQPFKELKEYQDNLLQYSRDSGLLSQETYEAIKDLNKDYVPFQRVMEGKAGAGPSTGRGLEARQPTKRIKGSTRDIYDPLESIIKNTYVTLELSEKNAALQALTKLAESRPGSGDLVEKIPTPQTMIQGVTPEGEAFAVFRPKAFIPDQNVISVWKDGKREFYQVSPELGRAIKALDRESTNMLVRFLSKPTEWLRAGATMSPDFLARNVIRDQLSAGVFSESGYKPFLDYARGVFSALKADEYYQGWLKGGGASTFLHSMDRNYMQEHLSQMLRKTPVWNKVNPYRWLRTLSEFSELGTRVGEARRVLRKAGPGREGAIEAGYAAREVSLDFSRAGSKGRFLNNIIAFFNASMQGMDKLARKFREDPAGASARAFVSVTIPSLLLAWYNKDNKKIQAKRRWEKDLFWLVDTGNVVWRLPKPFDIGLLFGTLPERIFDHVYQRDPAALDGMMETLLRSSSPGMLPTALLPIVENISGYSFFLGRDIAPADVEGRLPEYQYTEHTLELTKWLSKAVGSLPAVEDMPMSQKDAWLPPVKVENLVRGWTGGLGYYALQLADAAGRKAGLLPDPNKPAPQLADLPVIRAFVARWPTANTQPVTDFYERYNEMQRYWRTANDLMKNEFQYNDIMNLISRGDYKAVKGFADALGNCRKFIQTVDGSPAFTPDEQRELIDKTYLDMLEIARQGNAVMRALSEGRKEKQ